MAEDLKTNSENTQLPVIMKDGQRKCFVIVKKEARDLSTVKEEICEVEKKIHRLKLTHMKAKPIIKTADRSSRFHQYAEKNTQEPCYNQNRSKKIEVNDNSENWTESSAGQIGEVRQKIDQNGNVEVPSVQIDNGDGKRTQEEPNYRMPSPKIRYKSTVTLDNAVVANNIKSSKRNRKQNKKQKNRDGKIKVRSLKRYDNAERKKTDNDECIKMVIVENGADMENSKRKRQRQKDRVYNGKSFEKIIESESTYLLIGNQQRQTMSQNRNKKAAKKAIYNLYLSCVFRFLKEMQASICLLTILFNMLFHGGSCAMKPQLELVVRPTSPKQGQNVTFECMLKDDTPEYQSLVFQLLRNCTNQSNFQPVCFLKNPSDKTKFYVEKAVVTANDYNCKVMNFGIPDECDYRCDKGPTKSNIISIKLDSAKPETEALNMVYVAVGTGVALLVSSVICVVIVILVRKQRLKQGKIKHEDISYQLQNQGDSEEPTNTEVGTKVANPSFNNNTIDSVE